MSIKFVNRLFCNILKIVYYCVFLTVAIKCNEDIALDKVAPLVERWAPKVWLHPQERFFPSNVSFFLSEVTPMKKDGRNSFGIMPNISTVENSSNLYFVTNENIDFLLKDPDSYIHGINPSKEVVSIYAHIKSCDTDYKNLIVTFWFFYPFNGGKEVCTIFHKQPLPFLKVFNKCLGKTRVYGNHVGDWEHVTLEFKNGTPTSLFLSEHDVGAFYSYEPTANSFVLSKAKSKGLGEPQDPPDTVRLDHGHPVLYSAKGSHAFWAGVGSHKYTKLNLRELSDVTDVGTPWDTWRSVVVFSDENLPDWFSFQGRWGNPASRCLTRNICEFADGPRGLANRLLDFECSL